VFDLLSPAMILATAAIAWGKFAGKLAEKERQEEQKQAIRDEHERERHAVQLEAIKEVRAEVRDAHVKIDAMFAPIATLETRIDQTDRRVNRLENLAA
jgi:hypothetical protein